MGNELQRSFTTPHSFRALETEIEMAEAIIEYQGTSSPDSTFEDGVICCMRFVLGMEASSIREAFEEMMDEINQQSGEG